MLQSISIIVIGKVQGVFYRQSTRDKAIELNITGTVQNLPDGNVHIHATGTEEQLNQLITWCWQGPKRAKVVAVEINPEVFRTFTGFIIVK